MKAWYSLILMLLMAGGAMAFTTTKLDPRTRPSFKASPTVNKDNESVTPTPVPGGNPAFARTNTAASMSPAVYTEDEDDEELFGYGTALVSCAISLALGFTLGYGT